MSDYLIAAGLFMVAAGITWAATSLHRLVRGARPAQAPSANRRPTSPVDGWRRS